MSASSNWLSRPAEFIGPSQPRIAIAVLIAERDLTTAQA